MLSVSIVLGWVQLIVILHQDGDRYFKKIVENLSTKQYNASGPIEYGVILHSFSNFEVYFIHRWYKIK